MSRGYLAELSAKLKLAEDNGLFRLATLISQANDSGDFTRLIQEQLQLWNENGSDDGIDNDVLDVYRLLGGDFIDLDSTRKKSILSGLGWIRAISIFYWYNKNPYMKWDDNSYGKLSSAISMFEYFLMQNNELVDEPRSTYHDDNDPIGSIVKYNPDDEDKGLHTQHGLYNLLVSLFSGNVEADNKTIIACLRSEGFTRDSLDYRTSYVILNLLESIGATKQTTAHASIVRCHFISQLLSITEKNHNNEVIWPYWKWAVLVALQIEDGIQRDILVKKLIHQYACNEPSAIGNDESFVISALGIKEGWIHEALAFRAGYNFDLRNQQKHLYLTGNDQMWAILNDIVCNKLVPNAILDSTEKEEKINGLLKTLNEQSATHNTISNNKNNLYQQFFELQEWVRSLKYEIISGQQREDNHMIADIINIIISSKKLLDNVNNMSITHNNTLDVSNDDNDSYNILLYYMGTSLYKNMKYLESLGIKLNMDNDDNYNHMIRRNDVRYDDLHVSNDDSLKLLNKEIASSIEIASRGIYNKC